MKIELEKNVLSEECRSKIYDWIHTNEYLDDETVMRSFSVTFKKNEAWLIGIKIDPPSSLKNFDVDPLRTRKLLLKKKEIAQLQKLKGEKSLTIIMTNMYWKNNHVKCDIASGKGKKLVDQRQDIKKRDWERSQGRILKNSSKTNR